MAPKVKPSKIVYETKESMYERCQMMIDDAKWSVSPKFRRNHFSRIKEMLETLEGYKDSAELIKMCEERIAQTEPEEQEMIYTGAIYIQEHAQLKEEYRRAADLYEKIPGYIDADARAKACASKAKQMESKERGKTLGVTVVAAVVLAAAIIFFIGKVRDIKNVDVHGTETATEAVTEEVTEQSTEEVQSENE